MASAADVDSKTQATTAFSAPWRTTSADDFPPISKGQSIDQDRLACPCFSGEQVESWAKNSDGMIDNGVILSTQLDKHS